MACLSVAGAAQPGRAMILLSGSCHRELSKEVAKSVSFFGGLSCDLYLLCKYDIGGCSARVYGENCFLSCF